MHLVPVIGEHSLMTKGMTAIYHVQWLVWILFTPICHLGANVTLAPVMRVGTSAQQSSLSAKNTENVLCNPVCHRQCSHDTSATGA